MLTKMKRLEGTRYQKEWFWIWTYTPFITILSIGLIQKHSTLIGKDKKCYVPSDYWPAPEIFNPDRLEWNKVMFLLRRRPSLVL